MKSISASNLKELFFGLLYSFFAFLVGVAVHFYYSIGVIDRGPNVVAAIMLFFSSFIFITLMGFFIFLKGANTRMGLVLGGIFWFILVAYVLFVGGI